MLTNEEMEVVLNDSCFENERPFLPCDVSQEAIQESGNPEIDQRRPVSRGPHYVRVDTVPHAATILRYRQPDVNRTCRFMRQGPSRGFTPRRQHRGWGRPPMGRPPKVRIRNARLTGHRRRVLWVWHI